MKSNKLALRALINWELHHAGNSTHRNVIVTVNKGQAIYLLVKSRSSFLLLSRLFSDNFISDYES